MKVLMVEPGKVPYETEIEGGLESLQEAVGGSIQAVYPYDDPVALICNEEGKLMGLPLNRSLTDENGEIYDIIAGNFILTGLSEDNFGDLSPELMEKFGTVQAPGRIRPYRREDSRCQAACSRRKRA